jgi:hypothetical protein
MIDFCLERERERVLFGRRDGSGIHREKEVPPASSK